MTKRDINAGFLPLLDSAVLIAARECGFVEEQDIELNLVRETSWANIRDRMAIGHFEAAHLLAPMPVATNLKLNPVGSEVIAPMALGLGGNAVTISQALFDRLCALGDYEPCDAAQSGKLLAAFVEERRQNGQARLQFGVVHPFSAHNFELRYWLSAIGVRPDIDVDIVILPPSYLPDALGQGHIDGFCVGEPWNSIAIAQGAGKLLTVKPAIWASSPEKVLGVSGDWARNNPDLLSAFIRALYSAAEWCSAAENKTALAHILARVEYLNLPAELIKTSLNGKIGHGSHIGNTGYEPFKNAATFPWQSHALWFYSQMVRWGLLEHSAANVTHARLSYRPDLYREALAEYGAAIPTANAKVEGALTSLTAVGSSDQPLYLGPDGFFDNKIFDPDQIDNYIAAQTEHSQE